MMREWWCCGMELIGFGVAGGKAASWDTAIKYTKIMQLQMSRYDR